MRIGLLGGLRVEHDGRPVTVVGTMQLAVLFRLAVDAGTAVSYRAIAEDVWSDAPENERAALQSIVSRLRSQLPASTIESTAGGYRLAVARSDVDALAFADLVAQALAAEGGERKSLASAALELWSGEPWVPSPDFDWFERDLRRDRATALELGGVVTVFSRPSTIPVPLSGLVGREQELDTIAGQLATSRIVTIIGVGGAGKTRLAIETAAGVDGSILVELAPVGPDEIFTAILAATGRELRTIEAANLAGSRERALEALVGRSVLLVLDNCEHIIGEIAEAAEWMLGALPQLRILATSREPLTIPGEAFVAVGPLSHPSEADLVLATSTHLREFDAVELFHQRAVAARGTALDDDELAISARICLRLDGLPLALELAAAKLRTMTPSEVLVGLEDRFSLLTGGFRTALPRHRTLRAMIDWSWSLLSEHERHALTWVAVFPAGIAVSDAQQIAVAMGLPSASEFDALVDRSLLQRSRGRFRALETIREYGVERLAEIEQLAAARELQAKFVADRAAEFDRQVRGPGIIDAITWFDSEDDNIAAALRYATRAPLPAIAVKLTLACSWYWIIRGREEDARGWFTAVGPLASRIDTDDARIIALVAPVMERLDGDFGEDEHPEEVLAATFRDLADGELPAVGSGGHDLVQLLPPLLAAFGAAATDGTGWMVGVRPARGEDLGLDPWPTAMLHVIRAAMGQNRGDIDILGSEALLALEMFTAIGDVWGLGLGQQLRAEWLVLHGSLDEAFRLTEASTGNFRTIAPDWDLAQQQGLAISILIRQGRVDEVHARIATQLAEAEHSANARTQLQALVTAFTAAVSLGDLRQSVEYEARIDTLIDAWPRMPAQLVAWLETSRAGLALLLDDRDAAERAMRRAVDAALDTHDYPIIGLVAMGLGSLALHRGDLREALRAVDLSTAVIGIRDETSPQLVAIERAAALAGIERVDAEAPTRSVALDDLRQILRR